MVLTKEYKWDFYRVVEGLYSVLPPEKIRSRCGVYYASQIFPDLKEELKRMDINVDKYPTFHTYSEEDMVKVVAMLNRKWKTFLEKEIIK